MSEDPPEPLVDVAIVGAGISGLAAAWELQQRGRAVRVFEADNRPGGVIQTERFDGWTLDTGPDAFLIQKPAILTLCDELGLRDRLMPTGLPRTAFVLRGNKLHALTEGSFLGFPVRLGALVRTSLFSPLGKLRMAGEVVIPRATFDDESIGAFVRRRFGEEAVTYLAEPLLAGIHAGDVERLSMRALFPRLLEAERRVGSVLKAARAMRTTPSSEGVFRSLPGGTAELIDTLVAALAPGTLSLSSRVLDLRRAGTYVIRSSSETIRARVVLLGVPAYVASGLLMASDTTLAGLCDAVPYASTATVAFGYRREHIAHPLDGTGFIVPKVEHSPLLAATWVSSKWAARAPADHALLRAFQGGGRDPHRLDRNDADLIRDARDTLARLLGITGEPLFSRLTRWTRQSPQHEVGHLERVAAIEARLRRLPGLFLVGSGFRAVGIPDCIADARRVAADAEHFLSAS